MRPTLAALVLLVACVHETPPPVVAAPPPPPPRPGLAIGTLEATNGTLLGLTLHATGEVGAEGAGKPIAWSAKAGDTELGHGELPPATGAFEADLPLVFGDSREALAPYQANQTTSVTVEMKAGDASAKRALTVRSPLLPKVVAISVQASRNGPEAVGITYMLSVKNPNTYDLRIGTLVYKASLADKVIADTDVPIAAKVPGSSDYEVDIPAEANAQNVGRDVLRQTDVAWGFHGEVKVGGVLIPVELGGTLKLSPQ